MNLNMNMNNEPRPRRRKIWTEDDTEALRYWHGCRLTDGRIARKLRCSRRTILRQRQAMD